MPREQNELRNKQTIRDDGMSEQIVLLSRKSHSVLFGEPFGARAGGWQVAGRFYASQSKYEATRAFEPAPEAKRSFDSPMYVEYRITTYREHCNITGSPIYVGISHGREHKKANYHKQAHAHRLQKKEHSGIACVEQHACPQKRASTFACLIHVRLKHAT
jgi:hypothetical protein